MEDQTNPPINQLSSRNGVQGSFSTNTRGNGGRGNPLAALDIARNVGTYGNSYNPRGRGSLNAGRTPKGRHVGNNGQLPSSFPITNPITSKEGEEAHDATNIVFEVAAWNPNADEQNFSTHLEPGDPVFVAPTKDRRSRIVEMFNLGQLNKVVRDGYIRVMSQYAFEQQSGNTGDTTKFMRLLAEFGENGLELYHTHYSSGTLELLFEKNSSEETKSKLKQLHTLAISDQYYCMTAFGVFDRWKFVGFVLTTSDPLRINGSQKLGYSRKLAVNVTMRGEIQRALNLWGGHTELDSHSKLYFILRKSKARKGAEYFEIIPWGSRNRASVPRSLLQYRDDSGKLRQGKTYYVGYIQLPSLKKVISNPARLMASGLIPDTFDKIREAAAALTKFRVEVRMR